MSNERDAQLLVSHPHNIAFDDTDLSSKRIMLSGATCSG